MNWQKLERAVDRIERKAWGESIRISFLKSGAADPTRPQWEGRAILHTSGDENRSLDAGTGNHFRTRLAVGEAELFLTRDEYDGPPPDTKDRVRALDRAGQPSWEVSSVSRRYSNLIVLSLAQAG